MTRYSRSVIPGRQGGEADDSASLDRVVFGSKRRPITPSSSASDGDYPDPMDMDVDEAGFLVDRSDKDRRKGGGERRKSTDRRAQAGKRKSDFTPLREDGGYRADDNKRGPILLVGAVVIVAVFGVVVWNAYREGVRTDDEAATPQLATAGAFKTPPRVVAETPAAESEPAEVLQQLDGAPAPIADERPVLPPEPVKTAEAAPAPSKVTAPPPAPLKAPVVTPPQQQAAAQPKPVVPATKPVAPHSAPTVASAIVSPATPSIDLPKPSAVATAPAPVIAPVGAYKPAFSSGGSWMAQIAATGTEAGAISEWDRRAKALPDLFSAAERSIVQADVNGKTVYRVRAGSFASKADATAFCDAFKAKGGNCLPAAK